MHDIRFLVDAIEKTVYAHRLDRPGAFKRWIRQDPEGSRDLGVNEYGCADAANILYTLNCFPSDPDERADWVAVLQGLQNAESGLFVEPTHHAIHCTAHCIAALELFDVRPLHPLRDLESYADGDALRVFLDNLPWKEDPWNASHRGAGLYAARVLAGEADAAWQDVYFDWFWNEADDATGFWRKGCIDAPLFPHLAGTFHYLFNHEYARRPLRYPEKMVETCLEIGRSDTHYRLKGLWFSDVDWVYCLTRSLRQCGHRHGECMDALRGFADQYIPMLQEIAEISPEDWRFDNWNDMHCLFGATCALAELQQALPGYLQSERPLRLVLDRRPFI